MKRRAFFIILLLLAFLFGLWLARENRQFFRAMGLIEDPQPDARPDWGAVSIGMETWQVKDVVGPPEERKVERDTHSTRREEWVYGGRRLLFTNGILTSLEEKKPTPGKP